MHPQCGGERQPTSLRSAAILRQTLATSALGAAAKTAAEAVPAPIASHRKPGRRDSDLEDPPAQLPADQRSPKGSASPSENWVSVERLAAVSDYRRRVAGKAALTCAGKCKRQGCRCQECPGSKRPTAKVKGLGRV